MNAKGSVFKYPDNVDTDVIIPARHLNTQDPKELASHCMEDIDKDFVRNVRDGDVMVGGWNFGCGSSREHAPVAIKAAGISVVIAKSFARIFYRNSINIGLPIMECPEAVDAISAGDTVRVDFDPGVITDHTTGQTFQAQPFPPFIQDIIRIHPHAVVHRRFGKGKIPRRSKIIRPGEVIDPVRIGPGDFLGTVL